MNEEYSKRENPQEGHERKPSDSIVEKQQNNDSKTYPAEKDPYDEFNERMISLGLRLSKCGKAISKGWRRTKFHNRITVIIGVTTLLEIGRASCRERV